MTVLLENEFIAIIISNPSSLRQCCYIYRFVCRTIFGKSGGPGVTIKVSRFHEASYWIHFTAAVSLSIFPVKSYYIPNFVIPGGDFCIFVHHIHNVTFEQISMVNCSVQICGQRWKSRCCSLLWLIVQSSVSCS